MSDDLKNPLEQAMQDRNLWHIQDCEALTRPDGDRPAMGDAGWRRWPTPGPLWFTEAMDRTRQLRN